MIRSPRLDPIRLDLPLLDSAGRPTQQFAMWIFNVVRTAQAVADEQVFQAFDPEPRGDPETVIANQVETRRETGGRDLEPEIARQIALAPQSSSSLYGEIDVLRAQVETAAATVRSFAAEIEELRALLEARPERQVPRALIVESLAPFVDSTTAVQVKRAADGAPVVNVDTANKRVGLAAASQLYPVADATDALRVSNADGSADVITLDTTNNRVGVNKASPEEALDVTGNVQASLAYKVAGNQVLGARGAAVAIAAQATTETAGGSYTANEQAMLGHLKTDVSNLIAELTALRDRFKVTGGHGAIAD